MNGEIVDYLLEKIQYDSGLHCKMILTSIDNYPIHIHTDIQLIYVVKGKIRLRVSYDTYDLIEGDIHIINASDTHSIESDGQPNIILILYFDTAYFTKYHPDFSGIILHCDENQNRHNSSYLKEILNNMIRILIESNEQKNGYSVRIDKISHKILNSLIQHFQYFSIKNKRFSSDNKYRGDFFQTRRIHRVIEYIYNNYMGKMRLDYIADSENISKYYLSHLIKYATGYGFQDFVNFIRVEQSEKLVLGSDLSMVKIAYICGFSSTTYFNKHFKYWFGMLPAQYRQKFKEKTILESKSRYFPFDKNDVIENLKRSLNAENAEAERINISVDLNNSEIEEGKIPEYGSLLMRNIKKELSSNYIDHLIEYQNKIGLKKIEINGIFEESSEDNSVYPWGWYSSLFDILVNHEINISILIEYRLLKSGKTNLQTELISFFKYYKQRYGENITNRWQIKILYSKGVFKRKPELPVFSKIHQNKIATDLVPEEPLINEYYISSSANKLCDKLFNPDNDPVLTNLKLIDDSSYKRSDSVFSGDNGLVTANGMKKPSYFIFYFLSKMGNIIVESGKNYIITRGNENYQILLFCSFSNINFENSGMLKYFLINLYGLKKNYLIKKYLLKYDNSCFRQWEKMGSPSQLENEDIDIIQHNAFPEVLFDNTGNSSSFQISVILDKRDIMLITLEKS